MKINPLVKILSIDTSCDETSASVTEGRSIFSNTVWSQSNVHSKFGGVVPNTAKREHERKISWVVDKAVNTAKIGYKNLDAISVTVGPGLAIALGVGIEFAKNLSVKYKKPLIAVNHLEGHVLSPLLYPLSKTNIQKFPNFITPHLDKYFPAYGIVVSGGNTLLVYSPEIGKYNVLAQTIDDALGESLDKSARLLGLGYPGGSVLEKFAKLGKPNVYPLPLPMAGREDESSFSYSGLKSAFYRLVESEKQNGTLSKQQTYDLAWAYQNTAFEHFIKVCNKTIKMHTDLKAKSLLVGGGVAANLSLRKRIRLMCRKLSIVPHFPYGKRLYGDNAAMIGVAAYYKYLRNEFSDIDRTDRLPNLKIDQVI